MDDGVVMVVICGYLDQLVKHPASGIEAFGQEMPRLRMNDALPARSTLYVFNADIALHEHAMLTGLLPGFFAASQVGLASLK